MFVSSGRVTSGKCLLHESKLLKCPKNLNWFYSIHNIFALSETSGTLPTNIYVADLRYGPVASAYAPVKGHEIVLARSFGSCPMRPKLHPLQSFASNPLSFVLLTNCWQQKWWLFWHRALKGYFPMLISWIRSDLNSNIVG